ncbi:diaminopimelate decarboxylase [Thermoplasmatales archaeon BRNA1]|nr:diaminopimelate decarboxylase [Thermoplasmatales archaeon BRNA1]
MRDFSSRDNVMLFGGMKVTEIAKEFGTPCYAVDEARIRENYHALYDAFSRYMPTEIHYACKANTNLAVLSILRQEGAGIDAVSIGEVMTCLKAGFSPSKIMYTGVNVSDEELKAVVESGVMINLDSVSEMERLARIKTGIPVSFRITPGIGSGHGEKVITGNKGAKFGIPKEKVVETYLRAIDLGLRPIGIHAHIGSGGQTVEPFIDEAMVLAELINQIEEACGIHLEFVDIGGGIGVPYKPNEDEMDVQEMASEVTDVFQQETDVDRIILEPGRYIVCDAVVLLTKCVDVKDAITKKYIGVDAGFNTLIRPAMYDSFHYIQNGSRFGKAATGRYDIAGPICETGDYLGHDRVMPETEEGDIIVVYNAGAYGFSMSSNYNSRPLCAEVLVCDGKAELIRERETVEEMWRHQKVPERLKQ